MSLEKKGCIGDLIQEKIKRERLLFGAAISGLV